MATRTSNGGSSNSQESIADQIFKKLAEQAGVKSSSSGDEIESALISLEMAIDQFAHASSSGKSPQWLTEKLESKLDTLNQSITELFIARGEQRNYGVAPPDPESTKKPYEVVTEPDGTASTVPSGSGAPSNPTPSPGSNPSPSPTPTPTPTSTPNPAPTPSPTPTPTPSPGPSPSQSNVPAFDRPQAVVIMGPRPLPVTLVGGGSGGRGSPADLGGQKIGAISKNIESLSSGISAFAGAMTAAATSTTAMIDVLHAYTGAVGKLNEMVEAFDPGTAYLFTDAVRNLEASIGRLLVPAIEQATAVVNVINVALTSLGPSSKTLISAFAGAGAIMVALGVAAATASAVLVGVAGALTMVATVASAVPVIGQIGAAIGAVVAPLVALGVAAAGAGAGMTVFTALTSDTKQLLAALTPIMAAFTNSLEKIAPRILVIGERIAPVIVQIVEFVAALAEMAASLAAVPGVFEFIGGTVLAAITLLLAPVLLLAAAAAAATIALYTLLRAFGVIEEFKAGDKKKDKTWAASPASFGSIQSVSEKTYAAAYSLGTGKDEESDPTKALNTSIGGLTTSINSLSTWVEKQVTEVQNWIVEVDNWITKVESVGKVAVEAIGKLIPNVPEMPTKNEFRDFGKHLLFPPSLAVDFFRGKK